MISGVEDVPDEAYRGLLDYEKQAANWPAASPALPTAAMIGAFSALKSARSSLTTLPTALAPIGLMTVPVAIRWVVPLIDRPA